MPRTAKEKFQRKFPVKVSALVLIGTLLFSVSAFAETPTSNKPSGLRAPASDGLSSADGISALPLEPLARNVVGTETVHSAVQTALQQCMRSKGFDYTVVPLFPIPRMDLGVRYGLVHEARAQQSGYLEVAKLSAADQFEDALNPAAASLDQGQRALWNEAFFGPQGTPFMSESTQVAVSKGGCLEEGQALVFGDRLKRAELSFGIQNLMIDSYERSGANASVEAALEHWSRCMKAKGLDFEVPRQAMQAWARSHDQSVAITEARCNSEAQLARTWNAAEIEVQKSLIKAHQHLVDSWTAQLADEESAAAAIASR